MAAWGFAFYGGTSAGRPGAFEGSLVVQFVIFFLEVLGHRLELPDGKG